MTFVWFPKQVYSIRRDGSSEQKQLEGVLKMRHRIILQFAGIIIAVSAVLGSRAMARTGSADMAAAQQEIDLLIAGEDEAWNKGDATGFTARGLPDVVFTNIVGMFSVGKAPFLAQHERIFSTIYKGSTIHQAIQHVIFLKPDIAIVDTLAELTGFQHAPPGIETIDGAIHARLEQVLVRHKDGWWIASFHNVAVNAAASQGPSSPPK